MDGLTRLIPAVTFRAIPDKFCDALSGITGMGAKWLGLLI